MFRIGQTVSYVLLPSDNPVNPERKYTGIIIEIQGDRLHIQLTEPGYEGLDEWIMTSQVRRIESKTES